MLFPPHASMLVGCKKTARSAGSLLVLYLNQSSCMLTCMLLRSGAAVAHIGHLYLACPTFPPLRSCRPALPPPMLVVAAFTLALISAAVCFAGLALPTADIQEHVAPTVSVQQSMLSGLHPLSMCLILAVVLVPALSWPRQPLCVAFRPRYCEAAVQTCNVIPRWPLYAHACTNHFHITLFNVAAVQRIAQLAGNKLRVRGDFGTPQSCMKQALWTPARELKRLSYL